MSGLEGRFTLEILKVSIGLGMTLALVGCATDVSDPFAFRNDNLPAPDPVAGQQPPANFETVEFSANYGLNQIGAQNAYAKGAYGGGVVVAVIDTGIQTDHSDLDANVSLDSIDIVRGDPVTDEDGHGTHVSGTIAAEKNDLGMHGVAFDATILAIRTDTVIADPIFCGGPAQCSVFYEGDLINAIRYATGKAHVINLSLGGPLPLSFQFEQELRRAMNSGSIIVAATGNDGATEPGWPAMYAGSPTVNTSGQLIAVGAVDSTGTIAAFSNECGSAKDFCLVAPGVNIFSTVPGDTYAVYSGTSMATPHVSGAAALLIQTWPMLPPSDVVSILLTTATDLGAAGVDVVYGHGLLNLNAAMQPVGSLAIPISGSTTGQTVSLDDTSLSLGPAFGNALNGSTLLAQAFALDDFDRNFVAGLDGRIVRADRNFGLDALLAGGIQSVETGLPNGARVSLGVADQASTARGWDSIGMASDEEAERDVRGMSLAFSGRDGTAYRLGYDVTPAQMVADIAVAPAASLFWMPDELFNPQHGLVGAGAAFTASRGLGDGSVVTVGLVDEHGQPDGDTGNARIGEIAFAHQFPGGAALTARFSNVDERSGFLGSDADGGFAVEGANSRFYILGGRLPLGAGVELLGSYTLGTTDMTADGTSLLGDWSGARADAFGLGIVKDDALGTGARIGFLAGQPLRVNAASANLTVPVDYQLDKTVVQDSERVSLVPTGREIDLQLAYDQTVGTRGSLSGWLMMQLEPGHDADAPPAYGIGVRFSTAF